jgi:hypothetical protein
MLGNLGIIADSYNAPGGGGGFLPSDIAGLTLWLDADDAGTITDAGAGAVSQWLDKSANAYALAQAVAGSRPTTGTRTQNGRNVIDFDSDSLEVASNAPINNPSDGAWTIFAVALTDTVTGVHRLLDGDAATRIGQYLRIDGNNAQSIGFVGATSKTDAAGVTLSASTAYLFRSVNGGTTTIETSVDATSNGTTALGGTQNYSATIPLSLGKALSTSQFWDGWIAEVIAYNTALSGTDVSDVETYLTSKWGTP